MFAIVMGLAVMCLPASAQDELDEDFPPGLLARYTAAGRTVERVDPDVAFDWGSAAPDQRLPAGPFAAAWQSQLLVRQPGLYRFHAWLQGEATVEIDGKPVLKTASDKAGWTDGEPFELAFGEKALSIRYRRTGDAARLSLFWSSDRFPLEPVPAHLLYRSESHPVLAVVERGRTLFAAHRCNRCHRREHHPASPAAPSLELAGVGTDAEWLIEKITAPAHRLAATRQRSAPHRTPLDRERSSGESRLNVRVAGGVDGRMPSFGLGRDEAEAVAAFLLSNARKQKLPAPPRSKDAENDRSAGELLVRSLGCLACHRVGKEGRDDAWSGGDLSAVGTKRSHAWLFEWLARPEKLNADHRMPIFALNGDERRQLALYLSGLKGDDAAGDDEPPREFDAQPDTIARGRQLVEAARCAACHHIPGVEAELTGLPDLSRPVNDWSRSCLAALPSPEDHERGRWRPAYASIDREAIQAYLTAYEGELSAESRFDHGRRVLERRNCLACHERDGGTGIVSLAGRMERIDERLRGQSQGLIPPALTAVGDKLLDDALAVAV
ncbi:MAG: c-type cytochrome, partial [Planctomycetes bacterium]|nr:c-type cytochrome [Planctomycetota bacterium]